MLISQNKKEEKIQHLNQVAIKKEEKEKHWGWFKNYVANNLRV